MIPVVIGALGSISTQLKYYLELLDISTLIVYLLQKTALHPELRLFKEHQFMYYPILHVSVIYSIIIISVFVSYRLPVQVTYYYYYLIIL